MFERSGSHRVGDASVKTTTSTMSTTTEEWFSAPVIDAQGTIKYVPIDQDILQVPVFVTLHGAVDVIGLTDSEATRVTLKDIQSQKGLVELEIRLANEGVIILQKEMTQYPRVIPASVLTGCVLNKRSNFFVISFYYYTLEKYQNRRMERVLRYAYMTSSAEEQKNINSFYKAIQLLIRGVDLETINIEAEDWTPDQVLVLVNPVSGKKKGRSIFQNTVTKMLNQACTDFRLVVTSGKGFAHTYASRERLDVFSAILLVSGDGLYNEFINGIMSRVDWKKAIQIPIGIIPAGSNNTLAGSILAQRNEHTRRKYAVTNCMFAFIKGRVQPTDLLKVHYRNLVDYSGLYHTWGNLAEVYHKSRRLAWLGNYRLTFWFIVRLLQNNGVRGRVYYRHANADGESELVQLTTQGFSVLSVSNVSHLSYNTAIKPDLTPSGGHAALCFVRYPISRRKLFSMLQQARRDGSHIHTHDFESIPVSAVVIVPDEESQSKTLLDGEKLPTSNVEIEVLPSIAKLKY